MICVVLFSFVLCCFHLSHFLKLLCWLHVLVCVVWVLLFILIWLHTLFRSYDVCIESSLHLLYCFGCIGYFAVMVFALVLFLKKHTLA